MAKGLRSAGAIQFFVSDGGSPTSWAQLGEVVDLQEGARLNVAEASNLDSVAAEYIAALAENGLTLTIMYRPDIAVQQTLKNALRLGTRLEFKILFVASTITTVFFGFVTDFETLAKVGKMLVGDLAIKMDTRETETIPAEPLTPSTDKVLLHFNGADGATTTIDEYGNIVTLTGATLSTTQAKFGSSSLSLLSATNYRADVGSLTPNSSAWTLECFQFVPAGKTWRGTPFELINASIYGFQMFFSDNAPTSTYFQVRLSTNGTSWDQGWPVTAGPNLAKDAWQHIAACYDGANGHLYTYSNGVKVDDHESPPMCATSNLRVGADRAGNCVNAFIDEFRLSNFCRYPGGLTFVPPTAPFTS